jgi:hypothetical protein
MFILPNGSWSWKDREDFDCGIDDGVLEPRLRPVFEVESRRVLAAYTTSQAAFDPRWIDWRPRWNLPTAQLPEAFRPGASTW